ncbi:hypothetical protein ACFSTC_40185 [Nonomuraea ferruginea]
MQLPGELRHGRLPGQRVPGDLPDDHDEGADRGGQRPLGVGGLDHLDHAGHGPRPALVAP